MVCSLSVPSIFFLAHTKLELRTKHLYLEKRESYISMERDVCISKYESNTVRWSYKETALRFHVKKLFLFPNNLKRGEHVNGLQFNMKAGSSEILVFVFLPMTEAWECCRQLVHAQGQTHILFHCISHMIVFPRPIVFHSTLGQTCFKYEKTWCHFCGKL